MQVQNRRKKIMVHELVEKKKITPTPNHLTRPSKVKWLVP